jgi:acyl carrier protein
MEPNAQSNHFTAPSPEELLKQFPATVRESYARFAATRDPAAADAVVIAIIRDHVPAKKQDSTPPVITDEMTLTGDLGIDSVSIADAVFMLEEVFRVNIANKELVRLRTIGDLRGFIRTKLASLPAA